MDEGQGGVLITDDKVDQLLAIISSIAYKWDIFAGQLSVPQSKIYEIQKDTPQVEGYSMQCLRMLLYYWVRTFGRATTYQAVAEALGGPVLDEAVLAARVLEFAESVKDEAPSFGHEIPFSDKMSAAELAHWLRSLGLDEEDSKTLLARKISGLVFSKMKPEHIGRLGVSTAAEILLEDILNTRVPKTDPSSISSPTKIPNDPIWNTKPTFAFLQLIKWRNKKGEKSELRIFRELAADWEEVASLLGLSHAEIGIIRRNTVGDQLSSIRDTISKWLMNGSRLPNSRQYPVNWRGLYQLVDDLQQGTLVAPQLFEALTSSHSNVRRNF